MGLPCCLPLVISVIAPTLLYISKYSMSIFGRKNAYNMIKQKIAHINEQKKECQHLLKQAEQMKNKHHQLNQNSGHNCKNCYNCFY